MKIGVYVENNGTTYKYEAIDVTLTEAQALRVQSYVGTKILAEINNVSKYAQLIEILALLVD